MGKDSHCKTLTREKSSTCYKQKLAPDRFQELEFQHSTCEVKDNAIKDKDYEELLKKRDSSQNKES